MGRSAAGARPAEKRLTSRSFWSARPSSEVPNFWAFLRSASQSLGLEVSLPVTESPLASSLGGAALAGEGNDRGPAGHRDGGAAGDVGAEGGSHLLRVAGGALSLPCSLCRRPA